MRGAGSAYLRGPCMTECSVRSAGGEAKGWESASRTCSHSGGSQKRRWSGHIPPASILAVL